MARLLSFEIRGGVSGSVGGSRRAAWLALCDTSLSDVSMPYYEDEITL